MLQVDQVFSYSKNGFKFNISPNIELKFSKCKFRDDFDNNYNFTYLFTYLSIKLPAIVSDQHTDTKAKTRINQFQIELVKLRLGFGETEEREICVPLARRRGERKKEMEITRRLCFHGGGDNVAAHFSFVRLE